MADKKYQWFILNNLFNVDRECENDFIISLDQYDWNLKCMSAKLLKPVRHTFYESSYKLY
jgi:hypothetical protein